MAVGDASYNRVGNSVFSVDKAYILFHKKAVGDISDEWDGRRRPGSTDEQWKEEKNKFENDFRAMAKGIAEVGEDLAAGTKKIKDYATATKKVNDEDMPYDFVPIKVQYNPSTLQFVSQGGKSYNRYSGTGGNTFQVMNVPYEVKLHMDLIFDETVNSNAFATYDSSNIGSLSGIGKTIKTGGIGNKNAASQLAENKGKKYSVQNISELFVAAIAHPYTRMVCVVWNKTVFWGEITGVNVEYTMFNRDGDPIRSKVHVEIRQDDKFDTDNTASNWEKTFDGLFEAGNKLAQKATYSSTSVSENMVGKSGGTTFQQQTKNIASNFFHLS